MKKLIESIWLLLIVTSVILWVLFLWSWWFPLGLLITRAVFLLVMSAIPQFNYFLNATSKIKSSDSIAITFDDGPSPYTNAVLDILKHHNAKATFFCIGKQIERYPETFKRIIAEGHTVGNHSFSHSYWLGFFSKKRLLRELEMCDLVAKEVDNVTPNYYRPPFGITNPMLRKALKLTGHSCIVWSKRSYDTISNNEDSVYNRLTTNLASGDILLLHDTLPTTPKVLDRLLKYVETVNLKAAAISETHIP